MKLNTFTKMMLVVAFAGSQISAFALRAGNDFNCKAEAVIVSADATVSNLKPTVLKHLPVASLKHTVAANKKGFSFLHMFNEPAQAVESLAISKVYNGMVSVAGYAQSSDARQLPSVSAYPNPSHGKTRLALTNFGQSSYRIKVSNTIGKVVKTVDLTGEHASEVELDLSKYPAGVYFYSLLVNDKTVETKRLILQK